MLLRLVTAEPINVHLLTKADTTDLSFAVPVLLCKIRKDVPAGKYKKTGPGGCNRHDAGQERKSFYTCVDIVDYVDIVENVETVDIYQHYQHCINTKINPLSIENKGFQQNQ